MLTIGSDMGIVGLGYQGRTVDEFLSTLTGLEVYALVDVRLTPISRKRGFSKSALAAGVESIGVRYEHLRALGNPKDNRTGFAGNADELVEARLRYRHMLNNVDAKKALIRVSELADLGRVALLCFEADDHRCHRQVLLNVLGGGCADV